MVAPQSTLISRAFVQGVDYSNKAIPGFSFYASNFASGSAPEWATSPGATKTVSDATMKLTSTTTTVPVNLGAMNLLAVDAGRLYTLRARVRSGTLAGAQVGKVLRFSHSASSMFVDVDLTTNPTQWRDITLQFRGAVTGNQILISARTPAGGEPKIEIDSINIDAMPQNAKLYELFAGQYFTGTPSPLTTQRSDYWFDSAERNAWTYQLVEADVNQGRSFIAIPGFQEYNWNGSTTYALVAQRPQGFGFSNASYIQLAGTDASNAWGIMKRTITGFTPGKSYNIRYSTATHTAPTATTYVRFGIEGMGYTTVQAYDFNNPVTQYNTYTFIATDESHTMTFESRYPGTAQYRNIVVEEANQIELQVIDSEVKLDDSRAPYGSVTVTAPLPLDYDVEFLDPRDGLGLTIAADQDWVEEFKAHEYRGFQFRLMDRRIDHVANTVTLTAYTDESLLINAARVGGTPYNYDSTSVRDITTQVLAENGMTLAPGTVDYTLPSDTTTVRTNLAFNPRAAATAAAWSGSNSTVTRQIVGTDSVGLPPGVRTWARGTQIAATTGGLYFTGDTTLPYIPVVAGQQYTVSAYLRSNVAKSVGFNVQHAGGATSTGPVTNLVANTWTRVSFTYTAPAGATRAGPYWYSTVAWAVGNTLDATGVLFEAGGTLRDWFDGGMTAQDTYFQNFDDMSALDWTAGSGMMLSKSSVAAFSPPNSMSLFYSASPAAGTRATRNLSGLIANTPYTIGLRARWTGAGNRGIGIGVSNATGTVNTAANVSAASNWLAIGTADSTVFNSTTTTMSITETTAGTMTQNFFVDDIYVRRLGLAPNGLNPAPNVGNVYAWSGAANGSASTYTKSASNSASLEPGVSYWSFLDVLIQAGGLRLFCDERRIWRLVEADDYSVPGVVSVAETLNAVEGEDVISLTGTNGGVPVWATGVVIKYQWTVAGVTNTAYDSAGTKSNVFRLVVNAPYPGPGAALSALKRYTGRGRVQELTALADLGATPGMQLTSTMPDTPIQTGVVSSVTWTWSADGDEHGLMEVRSRGLVDTPATAWIFQPEGYHWQDVPVGQDWTEYVTP